MSRARGRLRRRQDEPEQAPPPTEPRDAASATRDSTDPQLPEYTAVLTRLDAPLLTWRACVEVPGDAADIVETGRLPTLITGTLREAITARMPGNPTNFAIRCTNEEGAALITYTVGATKAGRHRADEKADEKEPSMAGAAPASDSPV